LVSIVSHEIINSAIPITNLAGMTAQMLENESGEVEKPENLGKEVTGDIHQGLKIIESRTLGLISFVKATKSLTDIPTPNFRKILLNDLFARVTLLFKFKFSETGIRISTSVIPSDLSIIGDLELVEQVLINLIQNSIEAMNETEVRELSLIATCDESHIFIAVTDNGKGMSKETIEKIFLPFYSTKKANSGIGLSLSQQIMMLHHARLEVSSVPEQGTTFTMVF
jgi:two-component system, NtrC family, nitrogen regulation sensor histidine kinase NtrY